jgi:rRNA maturation protein Rpf1
VITTTKNPKGKEVQTLIKELNEIIPRSVVLKRDEDIPSHALLIKIVEENSKPYSIRIKRMNDELEFGVVEYKSKESMGLRGSILGCEPELIVSNMDSLIGSKVVEWLMGIFPCRGGFSGRQTVSFVNCNDYIFFRMHRYMFKNKSNVVFQEIGPHLTLRLKKIAENGNVQNFHYEHKKIKKRDCIL